MTARSRRKLAVILHADIVGSTALVQRDEATAHDRIQDAFRRLSEKISAFDGITHELRGDALLAEFNRASDAISASLSFQAENTEFNNTLDDDMLPEVRIGISLGEVIIADDTLTGPDVVLAQRIEQLAKPGGVCVSATIQQAVPRRLPFEFEDLGEQAVKGFEEAVRVYRVSLDDAGTVPSPPESERREQSGSPRSVPTGIAAIVLIAALAVVFWFKPWQARVEPASIEQMALELPDKPSIAVLAFTNLSGDPDKAYLSDGISENVTTALSRFSQFFVIARQSSFSYKGKPVTVKQVSEELGVRYVLEGSVQISGDTVRVTAQLINAVEGNHVWAESYDRKLDDVFAVQDEITEAIVATLDSSISLNEFERVKNKPPKSLGAYESVMLAAAHWFKYTAEDNERARELNKRALEFDQDYAEAYRGLTWVNINGYRWGWSGSLSRERSLELAFENARKGVALAPYNHRMHQALAETLVNAGQLDEASASYAQAIKLNPSDASVLASATAPMIFSGKSDQAIDQLKRAIRMNPYHPVWYLWNLGFAQYLIGDFEASVESFKQMKKMPNLARRQLAAAYVGMGKTEEARAVIKEFLENAPNHTIAKVRLNFKGKFANPEDLERLINDLRTAGLPE